MYGSKPTIQSRWRFLGSACRRYILIIARNQRQKHEHNASISTWDGVSWRSTAAAMPPTTLENIENFIDGNCDSHVAQLDHQPFPGKEPRTYHSHYLFPPSRGSISLPRRQCLSLTLLHAEALEYSPITQSAYTVSNAQQIRSRSLPTFLRSSLSGLLLHVFQPLHLLRISKLILLTKKLFITFLELLVKIGRCLPGSACYARMRGVCTNPSLRHSHL